MIPKKIHYCWFGPNPLPDLVLKCKDSWEKFLPEYEIKKWDESNFDLDLYPFVREAYNARKYAYVADVCRLYALKTEGGIYLDSDVEVLKPLDMFLNHSAFSGFESDKNVPTGIMGSEQNGLWANEMLEYYNNKHFLDSSGKPILNTNVSIITDMMVNKGFIMNNTFQEKEGYIAFYPSDYFCPKNWETGDINITSNSFCIHHFSGSWLDEEQKIKNKRRAKIIAMIKSILGEKAWSFIRTIKRYFFR